MSVEAALTQQLLNKPTGAAKVPLVADTTIQRGDSIVINNDGKAVITSYNRIPDNVISEAFMDYLDTTSGTTSVMQAFSNARIKDLGDGYFIGMTQTYDPSSSNQRYDVKLWTWKVDTLNQTGQLISSVNLTSNDTVYGNGSYNDYEFVVTPEKDYVLAFVVFRTSSSSTSYQGKFYRVTMNPTTRALSGSTYIRGHSGATYQTYIDFVRQGADATGGGYFKTGTNNNQRYFVYRRYYSSSFDSIERIDLDGNTQQVTSQSGLPSNWHNVHQYSMSYDTDSTSTLLYNPNSGYVNTLNLSAMPTTSSSQYDRIAVQSTTNGSDGVQFTTSNFFFGTDVAIDGKAYWCMWDGSRSFTTFRFNVGSGKASFDGKYTYTITDSNMLINMSRTGNSFGVHNKWTREAGTNSWYGCVQLTDIHSSDTDTPEDNMSAFIKMNFSTAGGGHFYPTFQGFLDFRQHPSSGSPITILDSNGITAWVNASDFSTTDNANQYKHGIFQISNTSVEQPEYAYAVKAIALEDATAGQTFDALSYAPTFFDSALTAGDNYDTHIVSSTDYLLEKM